ncbi:hypothetical protein [Chloroflexus sp.]|uniref:hypothetical protein n=1 Tax=Chloroflexus sp. TaxID=1904827 RepID=UPI00404AD067
MSYDQFSLAKIWRDLRATSYPHRPGRSSFSPCAQSSGVWCGGVFRLLIRRVRLSPRLPFDDDPVEAIARLLSVAIAEGRRVVQTIATLSHCNVVGNDVQVTLTDTNR